MPLPVLLLYLAVGTVFKRVTSHCDSVVLSVYMSVHGVVRPAERSDLTYFK